MFFMPHCGRRLYSNLLCTNWSAHQLQNVVLIGNSFDNFVLRCADCAALVSALTRAHRSLSSVKTARFMRLAHTFASEVPLPNDIGTL